jgi:5-methyltetrahydrofolate--homocysteine methyltransferase
MTQALITAIIELREDDALRIAQAMTDAGAGSDEILAAGRRAMTIVGERFERGEAFIPELIMAGEIMKGLSALVRPSATDLTSSESVGVVVLGTVRGDVHDIGKDIVAMALEMSGFSVVDLGVDVPPRAFVEKTAATGCTVVGLSCLLTTAFDSMKETVDALKSSETDQEIHVMIGGGPVNGPLCAHVGADDWGLDAMAAVRLARRWIDRGGQDPAV